jgi:XapX domain-containing protein
MAPPSVLQVLEATSLQNQSKLLDSKNSRKERKEEQIVQYVYFGKTELKALIVGLITGALYGVLNLPIPAPNVLGGNLAILFTFIGLLIVGLWRHEMKLGRPPSTSGTARSDTTAGTP